MSTIFEDSYSDATVGNTFATRNGASILTGTAPTYVAMTSPEYPGLRWTAAGIMSVTYGATKNTLWVSRIVRLDATPSVLGEIVQARQASSRGPGFACTATGMGRILNTAGSASGDSTTALPVATDFRLTFYIGTGTGGSGSGSFFGAKVYPDVTSTTPLFTLENAHTQVPIASIRWGVLAGIGTNANFAWPLDDDAAEPGPRSYPPSDPPWTYGYLAKIGG